MGARGPARKPDAVRRAGQPDAGLVQIAATSGVVPSAPKPPKGPLLAVVVEAWSAFWSSPLASLVTSADTPALRRLFMLYDERERAHRAYVAERATLGSTGQLVVNPFAKELASLDGRIKALEDAFGMNPQARLRLGISLGEAKRSLDSLSAVMSDDEIWDELEVGDDPRLEA